MNPACGVLRLPSGRLFPNCSQPGSRLEYSIENYFRRSPVRFLALAPFGESAESGAYVEKARQRTKRSSSLATIIGQGAVCNCHRIPLTHRMTNTESVIIREEDRTLRQLKVTRMVEN